MYVTEAKLSRIPLRSTCILRLRGPPLFPWLVLADAMVQNTKTIGKVFRKFEDTSND
jgi:hypothetical protein